MALRALRHPTQTLPLCVSIRRYCDARLFSFHRGEPRPDHRHDSLNILESAHLVVEAGRPFGVAVPERVGAVDGTDPTHGPLESVEYGAIYLSEDETQLSA
jgi:hypothetical protein